SMPPGLAQLSSAMAVAPPSIFRTSVLLSSPRVRSPWTWAATASSSSAGCWASRAEELDAVAAHVHGDAAARTLHVPEPARVGAVVLLGLLDQVDLAQRPLIDELLEPDVFRRETQLLGVHQLDLGPSAR